MFLPDQTVTFRAGLYSSILSAMLKSSDGDKEAAKREARLIQDVFRSVVSVVNQALFIARQWENIALRLVFESNVLSKKVKKDGYRNLLYADEKDKRHKYGNNGARKIHQWFIKGVFGSTKKHKVDFDPAGRTFFESDDDASAFTSDGNVSDPYKTLAALPDDPYLDDLLQLYGSNRVFGNIILMARRIWYRGFNQRWNEVPKIPSSWFMTPLIEEVASQIDVETATNLTRNFLRYQEKYIDWRLTDLRQKNQDLSKKGVPELLCYMIDMLPLDGRHDLIKLKTEIDLTRRDLEKFINDERCELAKMMGVDRVFEHADIKEVDDSQVDMKLALGFGEHQCIQGDFLFPALLEMSKRASIPVTASPLLDPGTALFCSTPQIMCNLDYFALHGLDQGTAKEITQKYKTSLSRVDKNQKEYDLTSIAFFLNVSYHA